MMYGEEMYVLRMVNMSSIRSDSDCFPIVIHSQCLVCVCVCALFWLEFDSRGSYLGEFKSKWNFPLSVAYILQNEFRCWSTCNIHCVRVCLCVRARTSPERMCVVIALSYPAHRYYISNKYLLFKLESVSVFIAEFVLFSASCHHGSHCFDYDVELFGHHIWLETHHLGHK